MHFKWKADNFFNGGDMVCVDQRNKVCAKFGSSMWALQKDGKFKLGPFVNGVLMDEVVVTGLTMLEARRRRSSHRTVTGAAGAIAGAGGVGC